MLAHRVADPRILELVRRWLSAGVLDGKVWSETVEGTPQGAGISPLLANVFLHYVLDLLVHQWRKRHAYGRVVIVRYADDFVMGFQYEADARKMVTDLRERLAKFGLMLHEDKTRLIEFGRLSTERREARGDRRPETFAFLGFTHYCARSRDGRFVVKRRTDRKRFTRKLHTVRTEQRRCMHCMRRYPTSIGVVQRPARALSLLCRATGMHWASSMMKSAVGGFVRSAAEASRGSRGTGSISGSPGFLSPVRACFTRGRLSLDDSDQRREEPSAGKPHARIRGVDAEWPSYPTIPSASGGEDNPY